MKYRYLSIFLILLILSIGAVSAQEDVVSDDSIGIAQDDGVLSAEYVIDDDNYDDYFNTTSGEMLENTNISDNDTLVLGNINDKVFNVNMPLTITSNGTTINNVVFILNEGSNNAIIENLNVYCDDAQESAFYVNAENVSIQNNVIEFIGAQNAGDIFAIYASFADNLNVQANNVTYCGKTNGSGANRAIYTESSENLVISGNTIVAELPAISIDWSTGTVYSEVVCLDDCNNAVLYNNTIKVTSTNQTSTYDTIYNLHIKGDNATVVGNELGVFDALLGYAIVVTGENFNITQNEIDVGQNGTYACGIDVESNSNGVIDDNLISVISYDGSAYGIYTANWAGDVKANITNNYIYSYAVSAFGMSLSGSEAIVENNPMLVEGNFTTGIASAVDDIAINNNKINALGSNNGTPAGYDSMGIETIGVNVVSGNVTITNNNISTTGDYAVDMGGTGSVTDNELVASLLTGDLSVDYIQDDSILVVNNTPVMELDYKLTNDTFFIYFDKQGIIKEQISADNLTFIGEFSNLVDEIIINKPVTILSDEATLNNISICVESDNVTVDGFNFIGEYSGISIYESDNIQITDNNFDIKGIVNSTNVAIEIYDSNNVIVYNNEIVFDVESNGTYENNVIFAVSCDDLIISQNNITASLPARSINWTSGTVYSDVVSLDDCNNAFLLYNEIDVTSNDQIDTYDTIYAVDIKGDNATVSGNNITVHDAPLGYAIVITGENFNITQNDIGVGQNGSYACGIDVESNSNGVIDDNLISVISYDGSAYGIYTANWAGDVKANITNNYIYSYAVSAFGMSLSGSETIVENNPMLVEGNFTTGIASAVDDIAINNNKINALGSNNGTPAGYDSMGIETTGIHIVSGNVTITNNNITTSADYAVDMGGTGSVTDNELVASLLTGDLSVDYIQDDTILVVNNTPVMELDYKLTNDTFFIYFDKQGKIKEQISADNLTFIGEFSNLVDEIIITRPVTLVSDNATLNNISIYVESDNVTVDGFNFIGEYSGIAVGGSDNIQITDNNFDIKGMVDAANVVIQIYDSNNVIVYNNEIVFNVESNGTYKNVAIVAGNCDDLIISQNNITASLPARSINWTSGTVYSEVVSLDDCNNAFLLYNEIDVTSNDQIDTYDTIYAVDIKGDNATVSGNNITVHDAPLGYAIVITGENFNITQNDIGVGQNGTYACGIDVESNSNGVIDDNLISVISYDGSAYGIYTANWAGDVKANITNNYIYSYAVSAFGMSLSGSEAIVENNPMLVEGNFTTGIASAVDDIAINNNKILANGSNNGTPAGYDSMGIKTVGVNVVSGNATITNNNITTSGDFAVDHKAIGQVTDNYLVSSKYTGDASVDFVLGNVIVANNTPEMKKAIIVANDIEMYYKNGTRYEIMLINANGEALVNKSVTLTINGASYNRTTNANGTASIAVNLNSGNYTASASYVGESGYSNATVENNVTILTTVTGDDVVKVFRNGTQYYATFVDGQGNPLSNGTEVTFNINGVMYTRKTNENGTAKLNINLEQGTYIITAINPVNGEMHTNNITVLSNIINNNDLVKYYRNASQYVVTVLGADGKVVGAGETVTFNINGVFYTRTTNASGQAKLNINLQPGDYVVTAEYNGCKVANNIEVKPVLYAEDLVKKYGTSDQFRALLVDGQGKPYSGQTVTFNINGLMYQRITNADGYASLNIKLSAAVNEYTITSTYDGASISNKIIIVP